MCLAMPNFSSQKLSQVTWNNQSTAIGSIKATSYTINQHKHCPYTTNMFDKFVAKCTGIKQISRDDNHLPAHA